MPSALTANGPSTEDLSRFCLVLHGERELSQRERGGGSKGGGQEEVKGRGWGRGGRGEGEREGEGMVPWMLQIN